ANRKAPNVSTDRVNHSGEKYLADLQVDVQISRAAPLRGITEQLAEAEKELQANPTGSAARFQRALAYLHSGENEKALEDLSWLVRRFPKNPGGYQYRAIARARLRQAKEAKDDLAQSQELSMVVSDKLYFDAIVSAHLGEEAEGMKRLADAIPSSAGQASFL